MAPRKILVTGGAGFVGSNLALNWKQAFPATEVIALDNLKRRGSELSLLACAPAASPSSTATFAAPRTSTPPARSIC